MGTRSDVLSTIPESTITVDFEAVYETELPRIYNFFRYLVRDDQIAQDLTAETFEKA